MTTRAAVLIGLACASVSLSAVSSHAEPSAFRRIVPRPDILPGGQRGGWIPDAPSAWRWTPPGGGVPAFAGSTVPWSFLTQSVPARGRRLYRVFARVRADALPPPGGDTQNAFIWLDGLNPDGRAIQTDWGVASASRTWTDVSRTVLSAPGIYAWRFRLAKRGGPGAIWFERADAEEGPEVLPAVPRGFWYRVTRSATACLVLAGLAAWLMVLGWRRAGLDGAGWAGLGMAAAAFMRLYRADLVEFKADQASTVWRAIEAVRTHVLPAHGLVSSYMTYQPPGLTWIFMPAALVSSDPLVFSLYEIALSLLALGCVARAVGLLAGREAGVRMLWVFAAFPISVLYSRLVWSQCLMVVLGGFFVACALALVHRGKGAAAIPLCGIASLAALTYFPGLLWLGPLAVVLWLGRRRWRLIHLAVGLAVAVAIWVPYLRFEASSRGYVDVRELRHVTGEVSPGVWPRMKTAWKMQAENIGMDRWRSHTGLGVPSAMQGHVEGLGKRAIQLAIFAGAIGLLVLWRRADSGAPERPGIAALVLTTVLLAAGPSLAGLFRSDMAVAGLLGQAAVAGLGFAVIGRRSRRWRWAADGVLAGVVLLHGGMVLAGQRAMDRHVGTVMAFEVPLAHKRAMAEQLEAVSAGRPVSLRYAFYKDCGIWDWIPGYTHLDRYMRQGVEMDLLMYETLGVPTPRNLREPPPGTSRYELFYTMGCWRYLRGSDDMPGLELAGPLGAAPWTPPPPPSRSAKVS